MNRISSILSAILLSSLLFASCSSVDTTLKTEYEDAVRIKEDVSQKYFQKSSTAANRDGRTLRGYVEYVEIKRDSANNPIDTVFAFRDKIDTTITESGILIPLKHIESIPSMFNGIKTDSMGGFNLVESFHVTKQIPFIRTIPVKDALTKSCNCDPFSINLALNLALGIDAGIGLTCFDRDYSRFWTAAHVRSSLYNDGLVWDQIGRMNYGGDISAGIRLGEDYRWLLGLTYTSGVKTIDAGQIISSIPLANMPLISRPLGLLTSRYYLVPVKNSRANKTTESFFYVDVQTGDEPNKVREKKQGDNILQALFGCMKPYVYNEFGFALDALSIGALSMSLGLECDECAQVIVDAQGKGDINMNWSLPLTYGMGIGIDIPVMSDIDLELDLGYRDIAVGDGYRALGFSNVPSTRRMGTFQLRLGVIY